MSRWQIMRRWSIFKDDAVANETIETRQLAAYGSCALLGGAGLGKTFELRLLENFERQAGLDVRFERLAKMASGAESLQSGLKSLLNGATEKTVIYLDALDEAMIPLPVVTLILLPWIRDNLKSSLAKIRITCRPAVWPTALNEELKSAYPTASIKASLEPLSPEDIETAAIAAGVDYARFQSAIETAGALALSRQPLTLIMLLKIFSADKKLSPSRKELFRKGVVLYATDREERQDVNTATPIASSVLLEAAERLACFTMLSGRDVVNLSDNPSDQSLGLIELAELAGTQPLQRDVLLAVGNSGLCVSEGEKSFGFAHRQFAEYLAGRRLAKLLPHQAKAMLACGLGWEKGVAGPLRETASFAAAHNPELASWVAERDPEIVGISDVVDDKLRRLAMAQMLDRFRRHELVASQLFRNDFELNGFRNRFVEADLRRVLRERGADSADVLECAIKFAQLWKLSALSNELAEIVLDPTAPIHPRKAAGYALIKCGTREARLRLKPLIAGVTDDLDFDLKGIALCCIWPNDLSVTELLDALVPERNKSYGGAYSSFLFDLDHNGFCADGHRLQGLAWARQFLPYQSDFNSFGRIARRIAHAAVAELADPTIARALADLLIDNWRGHLKSPLGAIRPNHVEPDASDEPTLPLVGKTAARRTLIEAVIACAENDVYLWQIGLDTPGLLDIEDFPWLLSKAVDRSLPVSHRTRYGDFAAGLAWWQVADYLDSWISVHSEIPAESRLNQPLAIKLDSEEATRFRQGYIDFNRHSKPSKTRKVKPPPAERVQIVLNRCETLGAKHFFGLCKELTLAEDSTQYEFQRFLSKTPGWVESDEATRSRVVESAKRFLIADTDEPERVRSDPINSIHGGYLPAIWLVMEQDRAWVDTLPMEWWHRWAWYLLRELHINMIDEPGEPKDDLLKVIHQKSPGGFLGVIVELASASGQDSQMLLKSLLDAIEAVRDPQLDQQLSDLLSRRLVSPDRVECIAEFVLGRDLDNSLPVCVSLLDRAAAAASEEIAVSAAIALLFSRAAEAWVGVREFLHARKDLARRVLARFAHSAQRRVSVEIGPVVTGKLTTTEVGELIALLMELFPPDMDPQRGDGAHFVSENDSAITLRDNLIDWIAAQKDANSILAIRRLDGIFGARHQWLRDLRVRAERAFRLAQWTPIPPASIASILESGRRRLIRSSIDALDGVLAALGEYEHRLHGVSPGDVEDLWNTPKSHAPSPKGEERVSDKVYGAIERYFNEYAVTAGREVQVFRRPIRKQLGGEPGSEVDVLVKIPAQGSIEGDAIAVPVEVKLSCNSEARTGLREQLVDRYMRQLGTDVGVFVVAWMQAPKLAIKHRPKWKNIAAARRELTRLSEAIKSDRGGALTIRAFVLNAELTRNHFPVLTRKKPDQKENKRKIAKRPSRKAAADAAGRAKRSRGA